MASAEVSVLCGVDAGADGSTKRICEVQVRDQVLSRDPDNGKDEAKTATFTIERHAPSVVDVTLHDPKPAKPQELAVHGLPAAFIGLRTEFDFCQ